MSNYFATVRNPFSIRYKAERERHGAFSSFLASVDTQLNLPPVSRTVNANTIQKLKIGKNEYAIPDAIAESDEPQLDENAKPEDIGKGTRLFFKDDKTTYYAKNVASDKKNVFVTKDGSDDVFKKSIAKIIQINNKKF